MSSLRDSETFIIIIFFLPCLTSVLRFFCFRLFSVRPPPLASHLPSFMVASVFLSFIPQFLFISFLFFIWSHSPHMHRTPFIFNFPSSTFHLSPTQSMLFILIQPRYSLLNFLFFSLARMSHCLAPPCYAMQHNIACFCNTYQRINTTHSD